jgi:hypothetical protein
MGHSSVPSRVNNYYKPCETNNIIIESKKFENLAKLL